MKFILSWILSGLIFFHIMLFTVTTKKVTVADYTLGITSSCLLGPGMGLFLIVGVIINSNSPCLFNCEDNNESSNR